MKKEEIAKMKEEVEGNYLKVTQSIGQKQQELQELANEKARLEGEFRLLERLETKETKATK